MWPFALGVCVGLLVQPVVFVALSSALAATIETRFRLSAQWQYSRTLPRHERPALWRWLRAPLFMWVHVFLFSEAETTGLTFKDGAAFERRGFGRAERVR